MNQAMKKKIAEIREALEKATPGPWKAVDIGMPSGAVWRVDAKYTIATAMKKENADIVANAPEWLRFLLDELERLEREYAEERAAHNAHVTELCELKKEAEQREKLVECLRFYERMARGREANDGGRRARTLLAEIGVTVE